MPVVLSAPAAAHGLREWTTAQARPIERLDYWVGAICEAFLEMDCSSRAADCFDGRLTHLPLDRLAVNRVQASTQDVYRTPTSIARSQAFPFYLIAQLDHPWHVKQGGHFLNLRPGDAVLVDASQPYELHFPHSVGCLSVQMPRAWVGEWLTAVEVPTARAIHREQGWGAVLSALCLQLGRDPALAAHMAPTWVEDQFGALLAAALEPPPGPTCATTIHDLHARAVAWMRERLDQSGWRAADLAQHLGVSPRSLHRAFARVGDTVAGRWRQLRLGHARLLLSQRRLAGLSVAEVGRRCGYTDASHFGRDFQRDAGVTPLRWRQQHPGG
ncbi:helix-turn-helix domain-containing protein [Hydrogenophaga sp. A37]|uniref:helix-turn-helix domain-containing protein n=1 Tax=Hydrogenophaga sp. A37 TaxID=1945864 RepID=UPI0009857D24|nr:helix-turn-helix domain-containing protein [Hydrogenophaga sp. A37]OOG85527.1 AraC family transcriptional regulator [Hydrogenophaga sp. A37]